MSNVIDKIDLEHKVRILIALGSEQSFVTQNDISKYLFYEF